MNRSAFERACQETRRLTSLAECLQDLMEDRQASAQPGPGGILDPESDLVLSLVSGIYGCGRNIVELMGHEISQIIAEAPLPALDEVVDLAGCEVAQATTEVPLPVLDEVLLAANDMLRAVTEVSCACEQLHQTPFGQEFALPDFAQLAQQSACVKQQFQIAYPEKGSGAA